MIASSVQAIASCGIRASVSWRASVVLLLVGDAGSGCRRSAPRLAVRRSQPGRDRFAVPRRPGCALAGWRRRRWLRARWSRRAAATAFETWWVWATGTSLASGQQESVPPPGNARISPVALAKHSSLPDRIPVGATPAIPGSCPSAVERPFERRRVVLSWIADRGGCPATRRLTHHAGMPTMVGRATPIPWSPSPGSSLAP